MSQTNAGFDPATQPKQPDRSLGELFGQMTTDVSTLFRKEIELAKVELRDEAKRAGRGRACSPGPASPAGWRCCSCRSRQRGCSTRR